MEFSHVSVLLKETVEQLNIRPDGIYVDGTLGGGGHAYEVLRRLSPKGRLIGIDQDADAIKAAGERLLEFGSRVTIVRSNYCNMRLELQNSSGSGGFLFPAGFRRAWLYLSGGRTSGYADGQAAGQNGKGHCE